MKLHPNLIPQESDFYWPNDDGKRRHVKLRGIWLGSPGPHLRHVFVPVMTGEEPPEPDKWGVANSRTGRPKIVSNFKGAVPGQLLKLSSYNGAGPIVGMV